jgi:hypothetical protein
MRGKVIATGNWNKLFQEENLGWKCKLKPC